MYYAKFSNLIGPHYYAVVYVYMLAIQLLHLHGVYVLDINAANYTQFTQGTPRGIIYMNREHPPITIETIRNIAGQKAYKWTTP